MRAFVQHGLPAMRFVLSVLIGALWVAPLYANEPTPAAPLTERQMDEITVVAGYQPGPGLWRVSKGEHEMWVLATISPLPKRMQWAADEVKTVIMESEEVIAQPSVKFEFDRGVFGMMMLVPSAMGARKNPDKETLQDQLPPALYQRWLVQKKKFMGRDRSVEKYRPIFAANELFDAVMDDLDLSYKAVVWPVVEKSAKKLKRTITEPVVTLKIDDTKGKLKAFKETELDDVACLESTISLLETELDVLKARANAWATGDVDTLKTMTLNERASSCTNAFLNSSLMKNSPLANVQQQVAATWLKSATTALEKNQSTLAILSLSQVLDSRNYLSALKAQGYAIEAPGESLAEPDSETEREPETADASAP
ncbi:TraB/GumN family protein [Ahniella affigens]|uniref:TraB/GumN family protein n=1 Tax=Ahniella affigens TaxID=2021234 RepID=A0A2P1PP66_9GAMM|nr:TraB/GumN family protein [Ahniella affigens]AVP96641.1 TraB/GumN family protein [Ahniella affigens]